MTILDMLILLLDSGCTHAPEARQFGGPFAVRTPEGRVLFEEDFEDYLNIITKKGKER